MVVDAGDGPRSGATGSCVEPSLKHPDSYELVAVRLAALHRQSPAGGSEPLATIRVKRPSKSRVPRIRARVPPAWRRSCSPALAAARLLGATGGFMDNQQLLLRVQSEFLEMPGLQSHAVTGRSAVASGLGPVPANHRFLVGRVPALDLERGDRQGRAIAVPSHSARSTHRNFHKCRNGRLSPHSC